MTMKLSTLLVYKGNLVHSIGPDENIFNCVNLLNQKKIGALVVLDNKGAIAGIVSERDVLHCLSERAGKISDLTVRQIMTPYSKLVTADKEEEIKTVLEKMTVNRVRHIPVIADGKLYAIVSIGDIVKFMLDNAEMENRELKDYISGKY